MTMQDGQHARVLIVERETAFEQALDRALRRAGLESIQARSGSEAEEAVAIYHPSLVILNPCLAPEDGWAVYRRLRQYAIPIMLRAPSRPSGVSLDRVAHSLAPEHCVPGEASPEEVAARARVLLQRLPQPTREQVSFGDLTLDRDAGEALVAGWPVALTRTELEILATLVEARGRVVTREHLAVRGRASASTLPLARSIEGHVRNLRHKLGDDPACPRRVISVRGFGYRLVQMEAGPAAPQPRRPSERSRDALAGEALNAMAEAVFVIDRQQRVQFMNRAAETLVQRPSEAVLGRLSCAALLRCRLNEKPDNTGSHHRTACPALETLCTSSVTTSQDLIVCPSESPLAVTGTASRLPGDPAHLLLRFRPAGAFTAPGAHGR